MIYLYATLCVLLNTVWLGLTLLGLPGNWLMVATAALFAWWTWQAGPMFTLTALGLAAGLAALAEVVEFLASMSGAKKAGGSTLGSLAALVGGVVGAIIGTFAIPIPLLGTILGATLGAFAGSLIVETARGTPHDRAVAVGRGAAIGHLTGTAIKFTLGLAIYLWLAAWAFL